MVYGTVPRRRPDRAADPLPAVNLPDHLTPGALSATIDTQVAAFAVPKTGDSAVAGKLEFTGALPEVHAAGNRGAGGGVTFSPGGAGNAAWQVSLTGPGRIFHLTMKDDTVTDSLIALGVDFGNASYPSGQLIANKAQSRGLVVNNMATAAYAAAYGIFVQNNSTVAPGVRFEQSAPGAGAALHVATNSAPSAGQKVFIISAGTGGAEAGYVAADTGQLTWNKSIFVGGGFTSQGTSQFNNGSANAISVLVRGSAAQAVDLVQYRADGSATTQLRINKAGRLIQALATTPADADIAANEMVSWLDATPGATKIMFKAKDSAGTVRTGSVALV